MVYAIEEMKIAAAGFAACGGTYGKGKREKLFYRPAGKRKGMYTPTQIICVSFVIVIALGTFLLSLPVASKHGRLDVLDAMFTATSATCVTGLIVRDTWTQFTYFGRR